MLVTILGQERGDKLLCAGKGTGCQDFGAKRMILDLLDIGLYIERLVVSMCAHSDSSLYGPVRSSIGVSLRRGSPWCQHCRDHL
jgi:hypothetical protein